MTAPEEPKLIGYSLSFCIMDILAGKIREENVLRLVTGTCAATRAEFENVLKSYKDYWDEKTEEGQAIAQRFWDAGRIDQPRVRDEEPINTMDGRWKIVIGAEKPAVLKQREGYMGLFDDELVRPEVVVAFNKARKKAVAQARICTEGTKRNIQAMPRLRLKSISQGEIS